MTQENWTLNYFNYFTEIEEHFQRARGTGLFLLSPLDWALIESWKNAGVPLEAVLRAIDSALEKWRSRRTKTQKVNSLAFCAQAVLTEAERMAGTARAQSSAASPYTPDELRAYLTGNAAKLRESGLGPMAEIAEALDRLSQEIDQYAGDLESLERRPADAEPEPGLLAHLDRGAHRLPAAGANDRARQRRRAYEARAHHAREAVPRKTPA